MKNVLEVNAENKLLARVHGKQKREVGLAVPAKFSAFTEELRIVRILERELKERAKKYSHFELRILSQREQISITCLNLKYCLVLTIYHRLFFPQIDAASQPQRLFGGGVCYYFQSQMRRLFEGGV